MAELDLRSDLDQIAMALEEKGHSKLASLVDICNHDIHTRKASVARRKPRAAKARVAASEVSGDVVKKLRWARAELRDIARDFRKAGSMQEARHLLRLAEDLAEDEREIVEGPVAEGGEAFEGDDLDVDLDSSFEGDEDLDLGDEEMSEGEGEEDGDEGAEEPAMDAPAGDEEFSMDASFEALDLDEQLAAEFGDFIPAPDPMDVPEEFELEPGEEPGVATMDDLETGEPSDEGEPALDTVEACVKEMRSIARQCRREGKLRQAAAMTRWAISIEQEVTAPVAEPVVPVEMPETSGEPGPVDASDYDLGLSDQELLDFAMTGQMPAHADDEAAEGEETPAEEAAEAPVEETTPTQYMEAAAKLARTASVLRKHGQKDEANRLLRKASNYKAIARQRSKK